MLDEIEPLTVDDLSECLALAEDRGWTPRERIWRLLLRESRGFGVRDVDGHLVGTVVLSTYGRHLAAIGMMLVATRYEGRGLGRRLMAHVLTEADGMTVCLYATDAGRPLYEKLGFVPIGTAYSHAGVFTPRAHEDAGTSGIVGTAATVGRENVHVRAATADDLDAIVNLDATVFGARREALLRRLPDFAENLVVAVDQTNGGDAIVGFAASWDGTSATTIGPVIAPTPDEARLLIRELATRAEGLVMLDLDDRRHDLRTWATAQGLVERATTTIMIRDADRLPGDRTRWFAPLAKAVG